MVFSTTKKLSYHREGHRNPTVFCADCRAGFLNKNRLNHHRREVHPTPPEELRALYEQQGKNLPRVPKVPTATITPQPPLSSTQTVIPAAHVSHSTSDSELNAQTENQSPPPTVITIEDEDNPGTENDFTGLPEIDQLIFKEYQKPIIIARTKTKKPREPIIVRTKTKKPKVVKPDQKMKVVFAIHKLLFI